VCAEGNLCMVNDADNVRVVKSDGRIEQPLGYARKASTVTPVYRFAF